MRNDPITDAIEYAHDHPLVVAGAAYVLGATTRRERRALAQVVIEAREESADGS